MSSQVTSEYSTAALEPAQISMDNAWYCSNLVMLEEPEKLLVQPLLVDISGRKVLTVFFNSCRNVVLPILTRDQTLNAAQASKYWTECCLVAFEPGFSQRPPE